MACLIFYYLTYKDLILIILSLLAFTFHELSPFHAITSCPIKQLSVKLVLQAQYLAGIRVE